MNSPVAVLRRIAKTFGCGYDDIERKLSEFLGREIVRQGSAEQRLDRIRYALGTGEADNVLDSASNLARDFR
jgi:hypothetical protein